MTTRTDPFPLVVVPAGGFPWRRLAFSFLLTLSAVGLFAFAFSMGYVRLHQERVLPGVDVAGVSLAGLDRVAAESKLRETLPSLSSGTLNVRFGEEQATISYAEIGRDYNMTLMLDQAFSLGRDGGLLDQVQEQMRILMRGVTVEPSLSWKSEELAQRVASVAASAQVEPVDAQIVRQNGHFEVVPSVEGQSVDVQEGVRLAGVAVNSLSAADTSVAVEAVPVAPQVRTETAQLAVDRVQRVTSEALSVSGGGSSATIDAERILGWVRLEEQGLGAWAVNIERDPIVQFVEQYAAQVDKAAVDASFAFKGGDVVAVAGENGQAVDVQASVESILAALGARADGGGPGQVNMAIGVVEPDLSYEQAKAMAPRVERLGKWRTNFVPGVSNYNGRNIAIPTDKIDGTVLNPGERFDFWEIVGEPTEAEGYGQGGAIIRGRTRLDGALAGGICSCSTTIFNAALRSGLEMGARKNHYYYITRYPVGLDATVWISGSGARQTMRFTNDMEYPILIRGINKRGAVIFEVWGVPDGRTVSFSKARIENRKPAYEVLQYTNNLPAGKRKRVEYPASGFDAYVTRTVRDANGKVIHSDTYSSHYARVLGITLVGRADGDPKHGTRVPVGRGGN
jgi:vancomycin resistance protein YoaR